MTTISPHPHFARCACGQVELEVIGEPFLSAICHCSDCYEAARKLEVLPGSTPILDSDGGTAFALYRRDRVKYKKGNEHLEKFRVEPDSPDRVFASCCGSAMIMDLDKVMHWIPVYRSRLGSNAPASEMRINFKKVSAHRPTDVPTYAGIPLRFIWKLIVAKISMLLSC
jgi:hypothetical protein